MDESTREEIKKVAREAAGDLLKANETLIRHSREKLEKELADREPQIAAEIHNSLRHSLVHRYQVFIWLCALGGPIIGALCGFFVSSGWINSVADEKTKKVDEALARAFEVKGMMDTLVQHNGIQGLLTFKQNETEVTSSLDKLSKLVTKQQETLQSIDFESLNTRAKKALELAGAVEALEKLFQSKNEAKALAGAFFKIWELSGTEFVIELVTSQGAMTAPIPEFDSTAPLTQGIKLSSNLTFSSSKEKREPKSDYQLTWEGLDVYVTRRAVTPKRQLFESETEVDFAVRFYISHLPNQSPNWRFEGKNGEVPRLKKINLNDLALFDTIQLSLGSADKAVIDNTQLWRALPALSVAIKESPLLPARIEMNLFANQQPLELGAGNLPKNWQVGPANIKVGKGIKGLLNNKDPEPNKVVYEIAAPEWFSGLDSQYVKSLSKETKN